MPRKSTNPDKKPYQARREELGYSREKAAMILDGITEDRLEKIENGRTIPTPEDILQFADKYKDPTLCNSYCSGECAIGRHYVPQVEVKELPSIVLGMIATINNVTTMRERLIAIAADGVIDESEMEDFNQIQEQLEELSKAVEALQLWVEKTAKDQEQ